MGQTIAGGCVCGSHSKESLQDSAFDAFEQKHEITAQSVRAYYFQQHPTPQTSQQL